LITAAGGKDKVPAYCADLLGHKAGKPSADHPTGKPGDVPNPAKPDEAHPTGGPTSRPSR
jgi:hypothetical protein